MTLSEIPTADLRAELQRRAKPQADPLATIAARLCRVAARHYLVDPNAICRRSQLREVVSARWAVFEALRVRGFSDRRIGDVFGMDRGTVTYGWVKVRLAASDSTLAAALAEMAEV